jgi:phage terminase small subunit
LAYSSSEKFLKVFVGKKDIEDALQRLEKVTVEEARMAAAEALKAVHGTKVEVGDKVDGVQDTLKVVEERMRGVEGMLQGVGDILQGVDGRVKDIGNKVTIGASTDQLALLLSLLLRLGVEKTGQQMANVDDKV